MHHLRKTRYHAHSRARQMELGLSITTGLITGLEGAHFFSARLPSAMTTKKFADRPEDLANLQQGIAEAVVLSLVTAGAISGIYKWVKIRYWWIPLATNIVVTSVLAGLYLNDLNQASAGLNNRNGVR
jgi:hypothetical protein